MNHHKKQNNKKHISVDNAIQKFISRTKFVPKTQTVSIHNSTNHVLAQNITSKIEIPSFDKSSMDGFAIKSHDTINATKKNLISLKIIGKIFAGENTKKNLKSGEAIAVATGAAIPNGADAVIMVEDVIVNQDNIQISKKIKKQSNLALRGEEVRKNQLILKKGTWLTPQDIGLIASIGINKVPVFVKPNVGILATGNELVEPGKPLKKGKIFESNRIVVAELVKQMGGKVKDLGIVRDDKKIIKKKMRNALSNDVLVVTGGSSVGEKDFVPEIINELGKPGVLVRGISMKPGAPTTLGIINNTPVIVCPGFPVSGFFAFLVFGTALFRSMLFTDGLPLSKSQAIMEDSINTNQNVTNFVRVKLRKKNNTIFASSISAADSRLLITLTNSDGVIIAKNKKRIKRGEKVEVLTFRNFSKENV